MKKLKALAYLILALIFALIIFWTYPNLNPLYPDGFAFDAFIVTCFAVLTLILSGAGTLADVFKNGPDRHKWHGRKSAVLLVLAVGPWVALAGIWIFSSVLFHQTKYKEQMPQPETRKFTSDVQPLDTTELRVVDEDLAKLLADKKLGEKPALGSQVVLGEPTIQKVNGKLEWVVPLEHSGFFKWLSNMSGSAGYIVVSATDPRSVTYVDNYKIKVQPNAYILDNLGRHARLYGGLFDGLTDYSFEIDDSGHPYWVVTLYKNLAGFSLPEANGALIIDAVTGQTNRYSLSNIPQWVDRVQPSDYIINQLNNRGSYIHGIFNFSNQDKFQTSGDNAIVYYNGHCDLFTGLTSVGSDQSSIGFVLVDMVTKKPYLYSISGATESAAQQSAEGKVQNLHYTASYPLITNVDGIATYFMTLKDASGLIKSYAFVSVADYTTVGTGETVQDALDDYRNNEKSNGSTSGISAQSPQITVTGTVERISQTTVDSNTVYYVILKEMPNKIFTAVPDDGQELPITQPGDKVKLSYNKTDKSVISVSAFDNLEFSQS